MHFAWRRGDLLFDVAGDRDSTQFAKRGTFCVLGTFQKALQGSDSIIGLEKGDFFILGAAICGGCLEELETYARLSSFSDLVC